MQLQMMLQDGTQRYFIYQEEEPSHHFQPDTTSKAEEQTWLNPPTPPNVGLGYQRCLRYKESKNSYALHPRKKNQHNKFVIVV